MKKILTTIILALGLSAAANAQSKAIGIHFGPQTEMSYQHYMGRGDNFMEATLGLDMASINVLNSFGFMATATYNIVFAEPHWTTKGTWQGYAGPGVSLGYVGEGFMTGIAAQVGLSYRFWFPLQVSASLRPIFGIHVTGNKELQPKPVAFFTWGVGYNLIPSISVHYTF